MFAWPTEATPRRKLATPRRKLAAPRRKLATPLGGWLPFAKSRLSPVGISSTPRGLCAATRGAASVLGVCPGGDEGRHAWGLESYVNLKVRVIVRRGGTSERRVDSRLLEGH